MRIGLRQANQRFSRIVKAVRAGREVVLTDRGRPVAVMRPAPEPAPGEEWLRRLEAAGLIRPATRRRPMPVWNPRPIRGVPVSRTVREERDSS